MFYSQRSFPKLRADRVVAHSCDGVVAITLSRHVSRCLGISAGLRLRIGYGRSPGEIIIAKAQGNTSQTVNCYQNGSEVAFNIRAAYLPLPTKDGHAVIPHYWRNTETIALDFTPLATERTSERAVITNRS